MSKYRTNTEQLSSALKALGNPNRLRILTRLVECCAPGTRGWPTGSEMRVCVGELGQDLGIAPSTVSHHISQLRHAGLIHMERHGQYVECWVAQEALHMLGAFFAQLASPGAISRRNQSRKGREA